MGKFKVRGVDDLDLAISELNVTFHIWFVQKDMI
jgi:hypothetical protein